MYWISKKDKLNILRIFLKHDCEVSMDTLMKEFSYAQTSKIKKDKIKHIIVALEEDLNETVRVRFFRILPQRYILYFCKGENDGGEPNRRNNPNGIRLWHERRRS